MKEADGTRLEQVHGEQRELSLAADRRKGNVAHARFFVRIGQVGRATEARDPYTLPLFPLLHTLALDLDVETRRFGEQGAMT